MKDGGPAFSHVVLERIAEERDEVLYHERGGLTVRDCFAAAALSQIRVVYEIEATDTELPRHMTRSKAYAQYAYELADAMMKEREKK
jgi:hypothetical protein